MLAKTRASKPALGRARRVTCPNRTGACSLLLKKKPALQAQCGQIAAYNQSHREMTLLDLNKRPFLQFAKPQWGVGKRRTRLKLPEV
ncbi:MAG: hypothetical protein JWQ23_2327 [Herminiimonas sp.]|nr:hypothetical protein [Herminiimonas sp.]